MTMRSTLSASSSPTSCDSSDTEASRVPAQDVARALASLHSPPSPTADHVLHSPSSDPAQPPHPDPCHGFQSATYLLARSSRSSATSRCLHPSAPESLRYQPDHPKCVFRSTSQPSPDERATASHHRLTLPPH